jgi:hypothetical protein
MRPNPAAVRAADAVLRLRLTAAQLLLEGTQAKVVGGWIDLLPMSADDLLLGVSCTTGLDRVTWRVTGPTGAILPAAREFLDFVGGDPSRVAAFEELVRAEDLDRVGYWVQARDDDLDAGLHVPTPLPLHTALALLPGGAARERVARWADAHGVDLAAGVERAVGPSAMDGVWLPLPGATPSAQAAAAADLADAIDVPALPEGGVERLLATSTGALFASVWVTPDGVAKLGLLTGGGSAETLIALSLMAGEENDASLARLQGALGGDPPAFVELARTAGRVEGEGHYELRTAAGP